MRADELKERYRMQGHEENGLYLEKHYPFQGDGRASSGSSLFYVEKGERTLFHRIDCDEYWCYHAGGTLEIWSVSPEGILTKSLFGVEKGAEPFIYFPKGVSFASKSMPDAEDGTFFSCITVPRFSYSGFTLVSREEICSLCRDTKAFFD